MCVCVHIRHRLFSRNSFASMRGFFMFALWLWCLPFLQRIHSSHNKHIFCIAFRICIVCVCTCAFTSTPECNDRKNPLLRERGSHSSRESLCVRNAKEKMNLNAVSKFPLTVATVCSARATTYNLICVRCTHWSAGGFFLLSTCCRLCSGKRSIHSSSFVVGHIYISRDLSFAPTSYRLVLCIYYFHFMPP